MFVFRAGSAGAIFFVPAEDVEDFTVHVVEELLDDQPRAAEQVRNMVASQMRAALIKRVAEMQ
jgi:hypothetical protein